DIFHLHINRAAPQLYSVHGALGAEPPPALPDAAATRALPPQQLRLEKDDVSEPPLPPAAK
ncbi:MAG TPA: hypothetical protein VG986_16130, partial [Pseudolabrys sp.]|nr:hypothetical protein [Pseudolabrys sp.]